MAAHTCCDVVDASATPAAATTTRRLKLRRRPSASLRKKARMQKTKARGGRRPTSPPAPGASRKRVMVIRRKMEALRRLVPECGDDGAAGERVDDPLEELLLHAAGYILRLQMQVSVMQVMVHALNNTPED